MHRMFGEAEQDVAEAVARWIRSGRRARAACTLLDDWIARTLARDAPPKRPVQVEMRGAHHDLAQLAESLYADEFRRDLADPERRPKITWGRRQRSRTRRSLRLGSFDAELGLVRMHPVLDQPGVPEWFVRYVLFHELLHAVLPPVKNGSRWVHHGPEFREREKRHRDYARSLRWEEDNLPRLIVSARRGTPMRVRREGTALGELGQQLFGFAVAARQRRS